MVARVLDGNALASQIREEVAQQVEELRGAGRPAPHLTAVLVGDDPASATYVRGKQRDCDEVGIDSDVVALPADTGRSELLGHVQRLNEDPRVSGMIVQMPLPPQIDPDEIMSAIDPRKDADGLTPASLGALVQGRPSFIPATPAEHPAERGSGQLRRQLLMG